MLTIDNSGIIVKTWIPRKLTGSRAQYWFSQWYTSSETGRQTKTKQLVLLRQSLGWLQRIRAAREYAEARRSLATTLAKCVLSVAKGEAQEACGIDQVCGGLQAGIESGVHAIHSLWRHTRWKTNGDSFSLMPASPSRRVITR